MTTGYKYESDLNGRVYVRSSGIPPSYNSGALRFVPLTLMRRYERRMVFSLRHTVRRLPVGMATSWSNCAAT